ncbi:hypothetical protein BDZ89DRAFT_1068598 [Hymenopellis radicata]|nr:hypothetical protein BDZ89DRAFT_1068598 [Hymenopellis radicata]
MAGYTSGNVSTPVVEILAARRSLNFTTSPRSLLRLARNTTNNPIWNTYLWADESTMEDKANTTSRRFEGIGSVDKGGEKTVAWISGTMRARVNWWIRTSRRKKNTFAGDNVSPSLGVVSSLLALQFYSAQFTLWPHRLAPNAACLVWL